MEMLLSGPLKALGWIFVGMTLLMFFFGDTSVVLTITGLLFGGAMVWVGRWVSAARTARLQRKWERHDGRVARLRGDDF
jgi:hypothetical protein